MTDIPQIEDTTSFRNVIETLNEYADKAKDLYIDKIQNEPWENGWVRNSSGLLVRSVVTQVKIGNLIYSVTFNAQPYWEYIEKGTKPHFPPVSAILKWIQVKPILPRADSNGKLPTQKQLAFLIGRKISKEGTKGSNTLAKTVEELNQIYLPKLQEALNKDFDEYSIKVLVAINKMIKI